MSRKEALFCAIVLLVHLAVLGYAAQAQSYEFSDPFSVVPSSHGTYEYVQDEPYQPIESVYGQCNACFTPNPPWFCSDPNHNCYQGATSVPLSDHVWLLGLFGMLFGCYVLSQPRIHTYKL